VEDSPLVRLLAAVDQLDLDAVLAQCSPDCRFSTVDGRYAEGRDNVRRLLADFMSQLRSTAHKITAEWHVDNVWFAEMLADYELQDFLQIEALPRAFVVRTASDGVCDIRCYGARERRLTDRPTGEEPFRIGGRLVMPL
jgi:hypothetical protein